MTNDWFRSTSLLALSTLLVALCACSSDDDDNAGSGGSSSGTQTGGSATGGQGGEAGELSVSGPVIGEAPPGSEVVILWVVSSGSPDHTYKFGDGQLSGAAYTVALPGDAPPTEAINSYGVGIGVVLLLEPGTNVPDGIVDMDAFEASLIGASPQHAVIWRDETKPGLEWSGAFPAGYGCGKCVPAIRGFDSYEPVSCDTVEVQIATDFEFCNWT